ncbi:MAG: MCE family protein [Puniceicoccaceae bacterium]|nr:MAG: MCE family protein [Puniceicoccaceae bacterium]
MDTKMQAVRVGLFLILGLALTWIVFESLSGESLFRDQGYELNAPFDDLKELKTGDDVRMSGVKIGSVKATRLENGTATAILLINHEVDIPRDSTGRILASGLLGNQFVGISYGDPASGILGEGDTLRTEPTADFNDVLAQVGNLGSRLDDVMSNLAGIFEDFSGEDGEGLIGSLRGLVDDNRDNIASLTGNLAELSEKLNRGEGTIGRLINDPTLYDELVAAIEEIRTAANNASSVTANVNEMVDSIREGRGLVGALLFDEELSMDFRQTALNIRELTDKLNSGEGTLGRLLADDSLYLEAQELLKKADRALDGISDQGPITAVGVAAGALF